ncbi:hypothetical protein MACH05_13130 [Qipengyuania nanhaisediminis]
MPLEREEPPFSGRFVIIEPVGQSYRVETRPALPSGVGSPSTFGLRHEEFGASCELWAAQGLPLLGLMDGHVAVHREE